MSHVGTSVMEGSADVSVHLEGDETPMAKDVSIGITNRNVIIELDNVVTLFLPEDYDKAKRLAARFGAAFARALAFYPQPGPEGAGSMVEADRG